MELKLSIKSKTGDTLINVPVVIVLIVFIMAFWVVIFGLVLAIITSCKIRIYRDKNSMNVNGIKRNMQETVEKIKVQSEKIIQDDTKDNYKEQQDNQEGNEIIIE